MVGPKTNLILIVHIDYTSNIFLIGKNLFILDYSILFLNIFGTVQLLLF